MESKPVQPIKREDLLITKLMETVVSRKGFIITSIGSLFVLSGCSRWLPTQEEKTEEIQPTKTEVLTGPRRPDDLEYYSKFVEQKLSELKLPQELLQLNNLKLNHPEFWTANNYESFLKNIPPVFFKDLPQEELQKNTLTYILNLVNEMSESKIPGLVFVADLLNSNLIKPDQSNLGNIRIEAHDFSQDYPNEPNSVAALTLARIEPTWESVDPKDSNLPKTGRFIYTISFNTRFFTMSSDARSSLGMPVSHLSVAGVIGHEIMHYYLINYLADAFIKEHGKDYFPYFALGMLQSGISPIDHESFALAASTCIADQLDHTIPQFDENTQVFMKQMLADNINILKIWRDSSRDWRSQAWRNQIEKYQTQFRKPDLTK